MKKILTLLAVFFVFGFKHPYYMSVAELKYNESEHALQGTIKLFVNDFEAALSKINGKKVDLINDKDSLAINGMIKNYIHLHFVLNLNGKKQPYRYVGFEHEDESIWVFIEVLNCPKPQNVLINNSLLYDNLKEQMNLVHLEVGGEKKSLKVVNPETEMKFAF